MSDTCNSCTKRFRRDWKFTLDDVNTAATPEFDDSSWNTVNVPHDWAIQGPFALEHDLQVTTIIHDGEKTDSIHTGRTGGLPHPGIGWYRKRFTVDSEQAGKVFYLEFDGVMSHSQVYVNGKLAGAWPYGYASFYLDVTEQIRTGEENLLAVRIDNKPFSSRWYPGAGIYRDVRLKAVDPLHIPVWGTFVHTPEVSDNTAKVVIDTEIVNRGSAARKFELVTEFHAPDGSIAATVSSAAEVTDQTTLTQTVDLDNITLWDLDNPALYTAVSKLIADGVECHRYETPFGIRRIEFDTRKGFLLNGNRVQFKGVCMHHDLGPLGAAFSYRAAERQLEIMQEMGVNALRTTHNPPAPEVLEMCDRMGILVIVEAFDTWEQPKVDFGYNILFKNWAEKDLEAMIKRDRNHPSVIMWSIGNEIIEQWDENGHEVARFLSQTCRKFDPTRPTTAGFSASDESIAHGLAAEVDVPGWNYKPHFYEKYLRDHPEWPMYGSETSSCVSSRGEYMFPAEIDKNPHHLNLHTSSYDLESPPWGCIPDVEFAAQEDNPAMMGEFVWTGFDYLGEPTPYKTDWPSRSSYFGIVDLCGIPKDRFYLYQSHWSDKEVLHLLPHWNWQGKEGEPIPVHCYTSFDSAELFVNGKSMGVKSKSKDAVLGRFRLIWNEVPYESGTLKVVAYDSDGKPAATKELRTAGAPARFEVTADRTELKADGEDLSFVTVAIVDKDGNVCPKAADRVHFSIDGPAEIAAVCNGDPTCLEPFNTPHVRAFNGYCQAIIRTLAQQPGTVAVKVEAEGMQETQVELTTS